MSEEMNSTVKAPWLKFYGDVPHTLEYPTCTMFEKVEEIAKKYPDYIAYEFMGTKCTYEQFVKDVRECAKSLHAIGIKEGDKVTIAMPNCPQGIIMFYAVNCVGAISNMIHPLSSEGEIKFFLNDSKSVAAITLDQFYPKFESIRKEVNLSTLIIARIKDYLSPVLKVGFTLTKGRKIKKIPKDADVIMWNDLISKGNGVTGEYEAKRVGSDPAVVLYSGGTTGVSKGILLSNYNFNALATQIIAVAQCFTPGDKMLAVMPIFHGFGLGVCIHSMLANGGYAILMPQLILKDYANTLKKKKPNLIAGVPTLYQALLRLDDMQNADLSCLKGVFSGGDSLSIELKKKVDRFLADHGAKTRIREGFGMTECVTASCLTPYNIEKEGSIGIPFPDTFYKIVKPGTTEEVPYGEEGEICLRGPLLMIEYVNHPEETAETLRMHEDGCRWLHSGDLGVMDEDGFIYYRQRMKRMIISSGYNIYPSQLENIIDSHDDVLMSCCIGVPDEYKQQKVKAFVMLKPGIEPSDEVKASIMAHCRKNIAKYAFPYDIEFRAELPKTLVGKVAYRILEEEEEKKRAEA